MRRAHIEPPLCCGINPSIENAAARKDERVRAVLVEDGKFQFGVEWRGFGGLPHGSRIPLLPRFDIDLDQSAARSRLVPTISNSLFPSRDA